MPDDEIIICGIEGCRLKQGHSGEHNLFPTLVWEAMSKKDKDKLTKAGFATPRGGKKGAYQNHVVRSNKVIIPYERFRSVDPAVYKKGWVVRLLPEQYFSEPGIRRPEFQDPNSDLIVGQNAFVLYRTHDSYRRLPPMEGWEIRGLVKDGLQIETRADGAEDSGHYVLRLPTLGQRGAQIEGPPQGIFAPEYADEENNYLCRCVLAWLIIHSVDSPYTTLQFPLLKKILEQNNLLDAAVWEYQGIMRHSLTACPLCSRFIRYSELHEMLQLDTELTLENAGLQIEGATRSTVVNLFHMTPLRYGSIEHVPSKVAWGHAVCNTKLGQRHCFPLQELVEQGMKVGIIRPEGIETFGWISTNWEMIRSAGGSVWIRLCSEGAEDPPVQPTDSSLQNAE